MAALASPFGALGLAFGCLGRPSETLGVILGRSCGVFWLLCAATATTEAMLYALGTISGPSGDDLGTTLGGIWEQLHTDHKKEQCFCMRKLGFMRLALEHGMPIIVVYAFGESQLYTTYPWAYNLRRWIAQNFYLGIPLITFLVNAIA